MISSGDLEGALSVVHEFPEHPPLLTSLLTLLGALVARQEGDGVKRVTDAIQNRVGLNGNQVDNILLFTYLRAGQVEHAREVITVGSVGGAGGGGGYNYSFCKSG